MFKKLIGLLNLKSWAQNFFLKTMINKGVKHAVTALIGIIAGVKIQGVLTSFGIQVNVETLQAELTVLFGGLAGAAINWGIKVLDKDGDGKIG